jgi:hypothetical protein
MIMLDDGSRDKGGAIEVLDVAQIVARSVGAEGAPSESQPQPEQHGSEN